ncbi:MAG: phospholipase D-like domain-containing protein [Candidatus Sericytochromatia bacterium]
MKKVFASTLALLALSACGSRPMMAPNGMNMMANQAPRGIQAMNANGPATEAQLFSVHFVKAYGETIAQNEPAARQDPNGPAAALIRLIGSARQTLDGAFFDIGDEGVVNALIQAHQRGVRVRIVTDTDGMVETKDIPDGVTPPPRAVIVRMQQAGIPVIDDKRSGLMHHKFAVADNQSVWMGSTNVTTTSLYQHNNNAIVINHPQVSANYTGEFERMFVHKIFGPNPARQIPFPVVKVGNSTIRTFFSPKGGGQEAILQTLSQARQRISFMTFSFTDQAIASLLVQKKQAGLRIEGVYDQCLGYGQYSTYHVMRQNQIFTRMDGNEALLHHKILLSDNTVITGSFNFSASADKSNNENMLIIENSYVASMYAQEYDRVMKAAQVNKPPKNKCPGQDD